jgi:hypothetical protein
VIGNEFILKPKELVNGSRQKRAVLFEPAPCLDNAGPVDNDVHRRRHGASRDLAYGIVKIK